MASSRSFDAIVIGGGHNGLVNGAYLAKSGLRTLIIERRHIVGGAAITEELIPGLSLHDVLVRPQPAAARHHPRAGADQARLHADPDAERRSRPMENGDYLLMGTDRNENLKEIIAALQARRRRDGSVRVRHGPGLPGAEAVDGLGTAEPVRQRPEPTRCNWPIWRSG